MKSHLRVVLANRRVFPAIWPHVGLMSLASYLGRHNPQVVVSIVEGENIEQDILGHQPDLIGFTSDSVNYGATVELAKRIKKTAAVPLVIGGVHITCVPASCDKVFSAAVIGEGEATFSELVGAFCRENGRMPATLKGIAGIAYWENNSLSVNARRELIDDLDTLALPAYDCVALEKEYLRGQVHPFGIHRMAVLMTSRGCPYSCIFCASASLWNGVRTHSAAYVVDHIEALVERFHADGILFLDDIFISPRARLFEMARLIRERGLHKKTAFLGFARANLVDEEMLGILKSIHVKRLIFGFESGSERMLSLLKNSSVSVEDNMRAARLCQKYGISCSASFIIGSPGEEAGDLEQTYAFLKRAPIDKTLIYTLAPYPGTLMWQRALDEGVVSDAMDFNVLRQIIRAPSLLEFMGLRIPRFLLRSGVGMNKKNEADPAYVRGMLKIYRLYVWKNFLGYLKVLLRNPYR